MLKKLLIRNYAIIKVLEVEFKPGMVIITGETGAGKSILMGALGLALGDRSDSSQLRDKEKKTIVEAVFDVQLSSALDLWMKEAELEWEPELILRREIQSTGKSRAFVNDTPVSLAQLQSLSALMVDLHQQFDTLELGNRNFQRNLLDARAETYGILLEYEKAYGGFSSISKKMATLRNELQKAAQEKEYKEFLLQELVALNWQEGEEVALREELNQLTHADQIRTALAKAGYELFEGEQPIIPQLRTIANQLQGVAAYHSKLPGLLARFESSYLEIKDIGSELGDLLDTLVVDELRLDQLNARLAEGQRLAKKHGLASPDLLLPLRLELEQQLDAFLTSQDGLDALEKESELLKEKSLGLASQLTAKRKKEAPLLEQACMGLLARVGMPNAALKIELKETELYAGGKEEVSFLFDANKSGQFEPLHKVASGGELSRLMLVLKSLVARSIDIPTLIFDEIDSGISGEAARQVGLLMEELSNVHQVISITHQPQIAARADQHLYVHKQEVGGVITTGIRELDKNERINTLAHMMAGENPSSSVLETAREMIK